MQSEYHMDGHLGVDPDAGELADAATPGMTVLESDVRARITDGIAPVVLVYRTRGTVTQLGTLTGHHPYPWDGG